MTSRRLSNTIGFDDAPFPRDHRGTVPVVGAVFADRRLDGMLIGAVEKDGDDAADALVALVEGSRFREHVRLVLLQGVAFGGFNVVDAATVHRRLGLPVLIVARRAPDLAAIREALLSRVPGGARKWALIEALGPMEPLGGVHVQRVGLSTDEAAAVIERLAMHGALPEPLRVAHLVAGALAGGQSRGRP
jgi:endonuclease V-like protein UPF0215 family